jgi:hypothetical protein
VAPSDTRSAAPGGGGGDGDGAAARCVECAALRACYHCLRVAHAGVPPHGVAAMRSLVRGLADGDYVDAGGGDILACMPCARQYGLAAVEQLQDGAGVAVAPSGDAGAGGHDSVAAAAAAGAAAAV